MTSTSFDARLTELDSPLARPVHARRLFGVFVFLCLVMYANAWYWPAHPDFGNSGTANADKMLGVPFRYAMWVLIAATVVAHVARHGAARMLAVLEPWMPFWLIGVLAGVLGIEPLESLRISIFWLAMALSAAVAGTAMRPQQALTAMLKAFLVLLAASILLAILVPQAGTQAYEHGTVWSGAFISKNQLGWVAALAFMVSLYGLTASPTRLLSLCVFLTSIACLVGSQSKGSLVAAAAGMAYMVLLVLLSRRFSDGLAAVLAVACSVAALGLAKFALPILLEMLGRDATLTGRTDIWDVYLSAMLKTPWLGEGPGAFTALSPITEKLAAMLADLGNIYTPHNMFLGAFGDAGVFGLAAFCGSLVYVGLIDPVRRGSLWGKTLAGLCVVTAVGGMGEAHEVYTMGVGGFVLIIGRAMLLSEGDVQDVIEETR